jgi:hypothetical protein
MVDTDLIKIFCNVESDEQKKKLQNEVKLIELNLGLEDWDMEKSIANLCSKYSKRHIKRIFISCIRNLTFENRTIGRPC